MTVTLKISTDNAAFYSDDGRKEPGPEVARILRHLASIVESWEYGDATVFDVNGNNVGIIRVR